MSSEKTMGAGAALVVMLVTQEVLICLVLVLYSGRV